MKKSERRRYSDSWLPVDAKDWTREDWQDLHEAMQTVIKKVSARHVRDLRPVPPVRGEHDVRRPGTDAVPEVPHHCG